VSHPVGGGGLVVHLWGVGGGQRTGSIREERIKGVESNIRKVAGCGRNYKKNTQQSTKRWGQQKRGQDWD